MKKQITVIFSALFGETQRRTYVIEIESTGDDLADCQAMFNVLNDPEAAEAGHNPLADLDRAMSPGDGIIIDGKIYRCGTIGWREVDDVSKLRGTSLFD